MVSDGSSSSSDSESDPSVVDARRGDGRARSRSRETTRSRTPTSEVYAEVLGAGVVAPAAPPDLEDAVSKVRVNLTEGDLHKHRGFAKGSAPGSREREAWMDSLPLVNDVSAMAPRLEKGIRGRDMKVNMSERQIIGIHDGLFSALNLITLSNVDNIRGTVEEAKYRDRAQRVISLLIQDVTVIRRESALTSIGLPPGTVSGIRKRTLDLVSENHPSLDNETVHNLFTSDMLEDIKKALKKKEKEKKAENRSVVSFHIPKVVTVSPKSKSVTPGVIESEAPLSKSVNPIEQENKNFQNNAIESFIVPKFAEIQAPLTAGRLKHFICNWKLITRDRWVLKTIKGYSLPFKSARGIRSPRYRAPKITGEVIEKEAQELLAKKAVFKIRKTKARWISPIFLVPKKDGSQRPVINLKGLNKKVIVKHFKMENLLMVKDLITKDAFMAKMDMKDAYFGVPIKHKYRKYLCFQVNGQMYAFRALPFGLATAPRVYTKVIRPIAAFLRKFGINLIVYLDDWLFLADTAEKLKSDLKLASLVLTALGLIINKEKSILTPTQKIEFLGLEIDSTTLCFSVPISKRERIKYQAKALLNSSITKARTVAQFCGLLASIKLASDYSALKARFLQKMLKGVSYKAKGFDCVLNLSTDAIAEAEFWVNAKSEVFSRRILVPPISMVVRTDASLLGWGCAFNGQKTGGRWNLEEAKLHINVLELRAALFGLQLACKGIKDVGIRLESDNISAIAYINKRGGTKSHDLLTAAQEVWKWALENRIYVIASHIPGIKNTDADSASRKFSENCEWELNQNTVLRLFDKWGVADVDLFASRANRKCEKYYSFQSEPGALGTDAFAFSWQGIKAYAFPPFSLVGKTLQKALSEGTSLILVTPDWTSMPSWSKLISVAEGPVLINGNNAFIALAGDDRKCLDRNFHLAAWNICSSVLRKWHKFCANHEIDSKNPSPQFIINFLQEVGDSGIGQSAIGTHRAAITSLLTAAGNSEAIKAAEPFLARFSKGLLRTKPTDPKRSDIWDVDEALNWIRKCWPLESLSPKILTLRTVLLLALCSPKRANELAAFSLDKFKKSPTVWEFRLVITKNRGFGTPHEARYLKFPEDKSLCPVENLEYYLKFTEPLRKTDKLLLSYQKPYGSIGSSTISRWLKFALAEAGIEGFTGHSTRSAATSAAAAKGLSTAHILSAANWSTRGSTFQKFYCKEVDQSFQETILG
uniref:Reverse transcriptase domain-containing protein n=1 Tax=Panagrolaimus sp. ES5 TaxID=591445 RepID=A0AC34FUL5_9BILA